MNINARLNQLPRALRDLLKLRAEYEQLIRQVRWEEKSIFVVSRGSSQFAGMVAAYALEWLLGWPVAVREASDFIHYSLPALHPRSLILILSPSGDETEILESARGAARQGATVLAITGASETPLAQIAQGAFRLPRGQDERPYVVTPFSEHAALAYLALLAAGIFNPRQSQALGAAEEFANLPERLDWMLTHLTEAMRSMAFQSQDCARLFMVGCGFYYPSALQAAHFAKELTSGWVSAYAPAVLSQYPPQALNAQDRFIFLSGSHSRSKKSAHELAARLKASGARMLAVTDANDRSLIETCHLALLLPALSEIPGSLLGLAFLQGFLLEKASATGPRR